MVLNKLLMRPSKIWALGSVFRVGRDAKSLRQRKPWILWGTCTTQDKKGQIVLRCRHLDSRHLDNLRRHDGMESFVDHMNNEFGHAPFIEKKSKYNWHADVHMMEFASILLIHT
jgi:hypothetical protein